MKRTLAAHLALRIYVKSRGAGGLSAMPSSAGFQPNATSIWWSATAPGSCPGGTSDNSPTFQRWVPMGNEGSVPKGRQNEYTVSAVPSGLTPIHRHPPNVETLGYYRTSLQDEGEILVALSFLPAVSPISNLQAVRVMPGTGRIVRLAGWMRCDTAGWKPALLGLAQQSESHSDEVLPLPRHSLARMRFAEQPALPRLIFNSRCTRLRAIFCVLVLAITSVSSRAADDWPAALARMPLAGHVAQLNRTNCVEIMLNAFQSNSIVKALIFMPGATDEFYMFRRARAELTNAHPSLLDAVCALTNQTLIRVTAKP